MPTIRPFSNLRTLPVRAARLAIELQNDEDPGILEGTPGVSLKWSAFLDAYRTAVADAVVGAAAGSVVRGEVLAEPYRVSSAPSGQRVSTRRPPSAP